MEAVKTTAAFLLLLLSSPGVCRGAQKSAETVPRFDLSDSTDNVTAFLLPEKLQSLLYWRCFVDGTRLTLAVDSGAFERTAAFFSRNISNLQWHFDRVLVEENVPGPGLGFEDLLSELAWADFCRAMAGGGGFETWAGFRAAPLSAGRLHNLALFRAIQGSVLIPSSAKSPFYDPGRFNIDQETRNDIVELSAKLRNGRQAEKTANLVVCVAQKNLSRADAARWAGPAMNALQASGYKVRVSFDRVLPGCGLYYFLVQDASVSAETYSKLEKMLEAGMNGSGPAVILHPLSEIRNSGLWKKIRRIFGIPSSEIGRLENPPESAQFAGKSALWGDRGRIKEFGMTLIRERRVNDEGGSVILSAVSHSETIAFILRSGNCYLVNGNYLDFEASYFLSRLMGDFLLAPALANVTLTPYGTAALAVADTDLKIKMSSLAAADTWKLILFNAEGSKVREESVPNNEIFEIRLHPWELLILIAG